MTMTSEISNLDITKAVDLSKILNTKPEEKAKQLPRPSGYRILCAIPEIEKGIRRVRTRKSGRNSHD
jgi:hypothetical protein